MSKRYTVWVGGTEVNDFYLTKEKAEELYDGYIEREYYDTYIEEIPMTLEKITQEITRLNEILEDTTDDTKAKELREELYNLYEEYYELREEENDGQG